MAQPTEYNRQANFRDIQASAPASPLPGNLVDDELNGVKITLDQIRERLARIQRDDGQLANGVVGNDQFKAELFIGFNPPEEWAQDTEYAINTGVLVAGALYVSTQAHTSSTVFQDDVSAGYWRFVFDFGADAVSAAASAASAQQSASTATAAETSAVAAAAATVGAEDILAQTQSLLAGLDIVHGGFSDSVYTQDDLIVGGTPAQVNRQLRFRQGTAAEWTSAGTTLAAGEPGWESDTGRWKIGDGATAWASLPYRSAGGIVLLMSQLAASSGAMVWFQDSETANILTTTAFGRSLLGVADAAALRVAADAASAATVANHISQALIDSDVGTTANKLVALDENAKLPAVDGSQLTNLVVPGAMPYELYIEGSAAGTWTVPKTGTYAIWLEGASGTPAVSTNLNTNPNRRASGAGAQARALWIGELTQGAAYTYAIPAKTAGATAGSGTANKDGNDGAALTFSGTGVNIALTGGGKGTAGTGTELGGAGGVSTGATYNMNGGAGGTANAGGEAGGNGSPGNITAYATATNGNDAPDVSGGDSGAGANKVNTNLLKFGLDLPAATPGADGWSDNGSSPGIPGGARVTDASSGSTLDGNQPFIRILGSF